MSLPFHPISYSMRARFGTPLMSEASLMPAAARAVRAASAVALAAASAAAAEARADAAASAAPLAAASATAVSAPRFGERPLMPGPPGPCRSLLVMVWSVAHPAGRQIRIRPTQPHTHTHTPRAMRRIRPLCALLAAVAPRSIPPQPLLLRCQSSSAVAVPAALVKQLRESTGAPMMDCRNALAAEGNDPARAVVWLRKKGLAAASKKAGRTAMNGLVAALVGAEGETGVLVEVRACVWEVAGCKRGYAR